MRAAHGQRPRMVRQPRYEDRRIDGQGVVVETRLQMRHARPIGLLTALLLVACGGDGAPRGSPRQEATSTVGAGAQDGGLVGDIRARFRIGSEPLLQTSRVERFDRVGESLVARLPESATRGVARPADVRLPVQATGAFEITDLLSGVAVVVTRAGTRSVDAETLSGYAVFRGAVAGADVLHRVHGEGTEDYVHFPTRPAVEELRYRINVERAAGLRLTNDVLEVLDKAGFPRLRVAAPVALSEESRVPLTMRVEGCAVDSDPAPPWDRLPVRPGQTTCDLVLEWHTDVYPLLVDPAWTTTGSLAQGRIRPGVAQLPSGRVLAVGGYLSGGPTASCEAYDAGAGVWAQTGAMSQPRVQFGTTSLLDGKVLVTGGNLGPAFLASAERYDPALGTWLAAAPMSVARANHAVPRLSDGRVLAAGGYVSGSSGTATAEVYNPSTNTWTTVGSMTTSRRGHSASLVPTGVVMAVGGYEGSYLGTTEVFNPATNAWSSGPPLSVPRTDHTAVVLADGKLAVVGGTVQGGGVGPLERFDPGTGQWLPPVGYGVVDAAFAPLQDGRLLGAGGRLTGNSAWPKSLVFGGPSGLWVNGGDLAVGRWNPGILTLPSGSVLVFGGAATGGSPSSNSELWSPVGTGGTCTDPGVCSNEACVDGVCCESTCQGLCMACTATKTGAANGTCAPVLKATDPDGDCQDDGLSCKRDGFCDGTGMCSNHPGPGCSAGKCSSAGDCASGFCVDGVCCDTSCTGQCRACSAAVKGGGVDGKCEPILDGLDPANECTSGGSGVCAGDFVCNGAGLCRSSKQGQPVSVAMPCPSDGEQYNPDTCTSSGTVQSNGKSTCVAYKCKGSACGTTCATSNDCLPPYQCVNGSCGDGKADGASCAQDAECKNLHCVDGVCCNKPCNGGCEACVEAKTGQPDGVCKPIPANKDPDDECAAGGTACGASGFCDGAGACSKAAASGTTCGATSCVGASVQGQVCDGMGACANSATPVTCSNGYVCVSGACPTSCVDGKECAGSHFCSSQTNTCVPKLETGAACKIGSQCQSGFCADGVCCESDCAGNCRSCNGNANQSGVNGKCENVKEGTDPRNKCDEGTNSCGPDGLCGKAGECRKFRPAGEACGAQTCSGTTQESSACDGFGMCQKTSLPCGSFACDPATKACKKSCASDADCAAGAQCDKATGQCGTAVTTCVSATEEKTTSGQVNKCPAGYACTGNKCNTKCSTNAECDVAGGFSCMGTECKKGGAGGAGGSVGGGGASGGGGGSMAAAGGSTAAPSGADDGGGCACQVPVGSRSGGGACFALALGLLTAARQRRRPARRQA